VLIADVLVKECLNQGRFAAWAEIAAYPIVLLLKS